MSDVNFCNGSSCGFSLGTPVFAHLMDNILEVSEIILKGP